MLLKSLVDNPRKIQLQVSQFKQLFQSAWGSYYRQSSTLCKQPGITWGCSHKHAKPISKRFETDLTHSHWNRFGANWFRPNLPHDVSWNRFGSSTKCRKDGGDLDGRRNNVKASWCEKLLSVITAMEESDGQDSSVVRRPIVIVSINDTIGYA